jgi:hypothetical protein
MRILIRNTAFFFLANLRICDLRIGTPSLADLRFGGWGLIITNLWIAISELAFADLRLRNEPM